MYIFSIHNIHWYISVAISLGFSESNKQSKHQIYNGPLQVSKFALTFVPTIESINLIAKQM